MPDLQSQVEPPLNLWISRSVLGAILTEALQYSPYETGGVLLGYWGGSPAVPVVTQIIGPGPAAVHTTESFIPDQEYHLQEISKEYQLSSSRIVYLGDWHTHPNGKPILSKKDRRTLRRIAKYKPARAPSPIMLVLAGETWCASASVLWPTKSLWPHCHKLRSLSVRLF